MTRADRIAGFLTVVFLALVWTVPFEPDHSYGWDESMHAALPGARMVGSLGLDEGLGGASQVLVEDCQRYPFVVPVVLGLGRALGGLEEVGARTLLRSLYCLGLFGVFLLAGDVIRSLRRSREDWPPEAVATKIAFGALAFGALCPLAFAFSGTLFLEVPFLVVEVFCLRAWLGRDARPVHSQAESEARTWKSAVGADLLCGVWLTICFFTKFNYAGLLFAALGIDLVFQAVRAARSKQLLPFLLRLGVMAFPLLLALVWWFVLPLPGGVELAAEHRENFLSFLQGNRSGFDVPVGRRVLDWLAAFVPTARFGLLVLTGLVVAVKFLKDPAVRLLWLVLLALLVPISLHPFHLERFLIPMGPPIWVLAALGLGVVVQAVSARVPSRNARWALGIAALAACLLFPARDARFVAKRAGIWNEKNANYLTWLFASWRDLSPNRRLPTSGLRTEAADHVLEQIAAELSPDERFGWIGMSSELSPAVLHLGILERAAEEERQLALERFQRDSSRPMWLEWRGTDPNWNLASLERWSGQFDVIFCTDPPDLKGRKAREWTSNYVTRLTNELSWSRRELGTVSIERPLRDPLLVTLFACRPPQ